MFSSLVQTKTFPTNTDNVFTSRSSLRYKLWVFNSGSSTFFISNQPQTAVGQGIQVASPLTGAAQYISFTCIDDGDCVMNEWHVFASSGSITISWIEVMACSCEDMALLTDALGHKPDSAYMSPAMRAQLGPLTKTRAKGY